MQQQATRCYLSPVSEPIFASPERRSLLVPILLAVALLVLAAGLAVHFYPATTVDIVHLHTEILPTHTVFRSDSIVLGPPQTSDVLFVASTIRVDNKLRIPITLDDFSCTLTDPSGAVMSVKASTNSDLAAQETSFPALKPLVTNVLRRDVSIDPGKSTEGTVLLSFPFTKEQWDARKSATIQVDIYHGQHLYVDIPR